MVLVEAADVADCRELAATSKRAFDHDVHHGAPGPGGPPGYDSESWHRRAFGWGRVFRLVRDARIVGGAIVIALGDGRLELGRIWLEPACQGHGLGAAAMGLIEAQFAGARCWTLETPSWNLRNQRFYTRLGYREVLRTADQVRYEKYREAGEVAARRPSSPSRGAPPSEP